MDLVKLISDKVQEIADNGTIDKIITKHTTKCVDNIVDDIFSWDGEGQKAIEKALKQKLNLPLDKINVSRYSLAINKTVEETLNSTALNVATEQIKETVKNVTGFLDKKEFLLSDIISRYIKSLDKSYEGDMEDEYGELSFHVNKDGNFIHIYFDKESDKEYYECKNEIGLYKDKIFTAKVDNTTFSPHLITPMDDFEKYLFQLYANNVTVIVDEDEIELDYYREDYN